MKLHNIVLIINFTEFFVQMILLEVFQNRELHANKKVKKLIWILRFCKFKKEKKLFFFVKSISKEKNFTEKKIFFLVKVILKLTYVTDRDKECFDSCDFHNGPIFSRISKFGVSIRHISKF